MTAESPAGFSFRAFSVGDIPTVVEFRTRMFRELGWRNEGRLRQVEPLFATYLLETLPGGDCTGIIAEHVDAEGALRPAGTVVLVWQRVPPGVRNLEGIQAYALGMYVTPEFRRRGVARALMLRAIGCATEHAASLVTLHASDLGKPLYERLGFTLTDEMRFFTDNAPPSEWDGVQDGSD
jgi:GNAT superfamily N-acetyltransferase